MTDQELNEAVARKLGHPISGGMIALRSTPHTPEYQIPDYCQSIEAAWEIVESITKESERKRCGPIVELSHDGQWHFKVGLEVSQADTAPRAICLAFLKLP